MGEPENPVDYLIYRLQGRWVLDEDVVQEIRTALYQLKPPDYSVEVLALQAAELEDKELDLLIDEMPDSVLIHLDEVQI